VKNGYRYSVEKLSEKTVTGFKFASGQQRAVGRAATLVVDCWYLLLLPLPLLLGCLFRLGQYSDFHR